MTTHPSPDDDHAPALTTHERRMIHARHNLARRYQVPADQLTGRTPAELDHSARQLARAAAMSRHPAGTGRAAGVVSLTGPGPIPRDLPARQHLDRPHPLTTSNGKAPR